MNKITGTIIGSDNDGKDWTGVLDWKVLDSGQLDGTIHWTRPKYDGIETITGTRIGNALDFKGIEPVQNEGQFKVVTARYEGTLNGNDLEVKWKSKAPNGSASGTVTIK